MDLVGVRRGVVDLLCRCGSSGRALQLAVRYLGQVTTVGWR